MLVGNLSELPRKRTGRVGRTRSILLQKFWRLFPLRWPDRDFDLRTRLESYLVTIFIRQYIVDAELSIQMVRAL